MIGPGLRDVWLGSALGGEGVPPAWPDPGEGGPGVGQSDPGEAVLGEREVEGQLAACPGAEQAAAGVGSRGLGSLLLLGGTG